jgi:hypothetical protein
MKQRSPFAQCFTDRFATHRRNPEGQAQPSSRTAPGIRAGTESRLDDHQQEYRQGERRASVIEVVV